MSYNGIHILNGDALKNYFPQTPGFDRVIVFRECLIEGPVSPHTDERFWQDRALFIAREFSEPLSEYNLKVRNEIEQLLLFPRSESISLWFEHDLFCQVNYWFLVQHLDKLNYNNLFRVAPPSGNLNDWSGFGKLNSKELLLCFAARIPLSREEVSLCTNLWDAYSRGDLNRLIQLSSSETQSISMLPQVIKAHADRFNSSGLPRPQATLRSLQQEGFVDFDQVFQEFSRREGIYGFGDLQIRKLLQTI